MKKILLFFIAIILVTIKVNAESTYMNYSIYFNQHASDSTYSSRRGLANITTAKYDLYEISGNNKRLVNTYQSSISGSFSGLNKETQYQLIERGESYGYYRNEPLDYSFSLSSLCSKISIDIEKQVINYELSFINKTDQVTYYYIYKDNGSNYKSNPKLINNDTFSILFDKYKIKTAYQMIELDYSDIDKYPDGIIFENDFLLIQTKVISIDEPYQPKIKIIKTCKDEYGNNYDEDITLTKKEDNHESITLINENNLHYESPLVETDKNEETIEIANEEILLNNDNTEIKNDILEENLLITPATHNLITKSKNSNKQIKKKSFIKTPKIEEELESNLIIEKADYDIKPTNYKYRRASNISLIISFLIIIFLFLVAKIIKKVQKN